MGNVTGLILPLAAALAGAAAAATPALPLAGETDPPVAVYVAQPTVAAAAVDRSIVGNTPPVPESFVVRIGNLGEVADRAVAGWAVSQWTGFDPVPGGDPSPYQRGPSTTPGSTAVQMRGDELGIWIDSDLPRPAAGALIPVCPAFWWCDLTRAPRPFAEAGHELAFRFDLKIPSATRAGGAEVYLCAYFLFRDARSGRSLWYGASVFDLRGPQPELLHVDNWEAGTGLPIVVAALRGGTRWLHPADGSAEAQAAPFSDYRRFEFRVGAEELLHGLAALHRRFPETASLSTDPADYQLVHINLNPEIYAPPGSRGQIGLAVKGLRVALQARPPPLPELPAAAVTAVPPPPVYRARILPRWFADNTRFWYRNDGADGSREFVVVDAEKGVREPAFDPARAAAALSQVAGRQISAGKLPVSHLTFTRTAAVVLRGGEGAWHLDLQTYEARPVTAADEDGEPHLPLGNRPHASGQGGDETWITFDNRLNRAVELFWIDGQGQRQPYGVVQAGQRREQHTYARHVWLAVTAPDEPVRVFEAEEQPATAVLEALPAAPAPPAAATDHPADGRAWGARSPDGTALIFLRDHNLWLYETAGGRETALSNDGTATAPYAAADGWWSPDSRRLAALRTELVPVRQVTVIESRPADQVEPRAHSFDYPKPGDPIARPQPRLFDIPRRVPIAIPGGLCPNPWSIRDIRWAADSSRFTFVYNQRGHQLLQVIAIAATSGQPRVLVDERSSTFICYSSKYFCEWLGDDELVWMSERDGWNHLWLYDAKAGAVKNQITRGEWVVQGVERLDRAARQIVFRAGGVHAGQDPYYTHFCQVNLDGSGRLPLTAGDGTHSATWSPDGRFFIDTYSRVDLPPVHELRRSDSGALVCALERADASAALAGAGRWPERFVAKGRDGQTDIFGIILRPRDLDPQRRYPVIEDIYAGPQASQVPKAFSARLAQQALADRGFIIVRIDGMGTSGRSKAFHDVCWQNLRDAGFPDRIAWIRAAAAKYPEMDLSRVGIYGGSAGGQNALAALLWHSDVYKVAVADCGCHDNRLDKMWWNEQWLGWPVGPQYEANSNVAHAQRLQGRLLLIVGELDRNVDPASTLQVADALVKADKDFELLVMPGVGHGAAETPYGSRRRTEFFLQHLLSAPER